MCVQLSGDKQCPFSGVTGDSGSLPEGAGKRRSDYEFINPFTAMVSLENGQ